MFILNVRNSFQVFLPVVLFLSIICCGQPEKPKPLQVFVDQEYIFSLHLDNAEIEIADPSHISLYQFVIENEQRRVITQHPDSRITFKDISVFDGARLEFGIALNPAVWDKRGDGVLFEIYIKTSQNANEQKVFSRYIDPKNRMEDRQWIDEKVSLKDYAGRKADVIFVTHAGPNRDSSYDWAAWSNPRLLSNGIPLRNKPVVHTNVLLITADTLRADYLGAYGNDEVKTPHLDSLAQQGFLFESHIAQSNITLPSHASILTSLFPIDHGVDDFVPLDSEMITLPEIFQQNRFNTIAFVSAAHLNPDISGFGQGFDEFFLCPTRLEGSNQIVERIAEETNREVFTWLRNNYSRRFFMWIHYFDPHAPYTPPPVYKKMYDQVNGYRKGESSLSHYYEGIDKRLAWVKRQLNLLKNKTVDFEYIDWLDNFIENTNGLFRLYLKEQEISPEKMSLEQFYGWLKENLSAMREGDPSDTGFLFWLESLTNFLKERLEGAIALNSSWLDGVADIQYPKDLYKGEISYLDEQIGRLFGRLKEYGLFDRTLIIFTSDHGESLGEHGIFFDHRSLHDHTVKVPLILKFPSQNQSKRIGRTTSSVDLLPTLLDFFNIEFPQNLRGSSLLPLIENRDTKDENILAYSELWGYSAVSLRSSQYKMIYELSHADEFGLLLGAPLLRPGRKTLFDLKKDPLELVDIWDESHEISDFFLEQMMKKYSQRFNVPVSRKELLDKKNEDILKSLGYIR